ncbi:MAG: hypothetical protein ACJAY8_001463 [Sphingobacteriales bacterium]|jgi:hypothetical protein
MLRQFVFIILFLISAAAIGQTAEISFDHTVHKFHKTDPGPILKHTYPFTNTGDIPLIIQEIKVACTCTKSRFPLHPVLPGQTDSIQVFFDTYGKIGYQDRTLEIFSNTEENPEKIRFKVYVTKK